MRATTVWRKVTQAAGRDPARGPGPPALSLGSLEHLGWGQGRGPRVRIGVVLLGQLRISGTWESKKGACW